MSHDNSTPAVRNSTDSPPRNKRLVPPKPAHNPPVNIYHELVANVDKYIISKDEWESNSATTVSIKPCPSYLIYVAKTLNLKAQMGDNAGARGHLVVMRIAVTSGINQLSTHPHVKRLIELKNDSLLANAGGELTSEAQFVLNRWSFAPNAPGGYHNNTPGGGFKLPMLHSDHARAKSLADDLGFTYSQLYATSLCFGFFNQPELLDGAMESNDYPFIIADTVHAFDRIIEWRCQIAQDIIKLMKDAAARRELKQLRRR